MTAATRRTPTPGSPTVQPGDTYADAVNREIAALWNGAVIMLTGVSGGNQITATCTPPLDAYAAGQVYLLIPDQNNTDDVTINIGVRGEKEVVDFAGEQLPQDTLVQNWLYALGYDGAKLRLLGGSVGLAAEVLARIARDAELQAAIDALIITGGSLTDSVLLQGRVETRSLSAPPASPAAGAVYIVGPTATGAWATHENALARKVAGVWGFVPTSGAPPEGYRVWVKDEDHYVVFDGVDWSIVGTTGYYQDSITTKPSTDINGPGNLLWKAHWVKRTGKGESAGIGGGSGPERFELFATMAVVREQESGGSNDPIEGTIDTALLALFGRGAEDAYLTNTSPGHGNALRAIGYHGQRGDQTTFIYGQNRSFDPAVTDGATSSVEGNQIIRSAGGAGQPAAGTRLFASGVQLGLFPSPLGGNYFLNKGIGAHVTLENVDTYSGAAGIMINDRNLSPGWENILTYHLQADDAPLFQITGRGHATQQGRILAGNAAEATPTYSWVNSVGMGPYRSADNIIGISTNGIGRVLVSDTLLSTSLPLKILNATAVTSGGVNGDGLMFTTATRFGIFPGSGPPLLSAAKGSLYLRSDGSGTGDRLYVNRDGATDWVAITTAA